MIRGVYLGESDTSDAYGLYIQYGTRLYDSIAITTGRYGFCYDTNVKSSRDGQLKIVLGILASSFEIFNQ